MIGRNRTFFAFFFFLLLSFSLTQLIHKSRKSEFAGSFRAFLSQHKLVNFSNHLKIFMKNFSLIHYTSCYLSTHLPVSTSHKANLHL